MSALVPAPASAPSWWQTPRAAGRAGLRLTKVALFCAELRTVLRDDFGLPTSQVPLDQARRARRLQWIAENMCALHGLDVRLRGVIPSGPAVIVANHLGYLDPVAIAAQVPCVALAKREVASWPVFGELMRRLGTIFVGRGDPHAGAKALRQMMRTLGRGVPVLLFPEGTTTTGNTVLPLHRGAFGIAARLQVPVVPIGVTYDTPALAWIDEDLFVPHYVKAASRRLARVQLTVGDVFTPRAADDASMLARRVRDQLLRIVGEGHA